MISLSSAPRGCPRTQQSALVFVLFGGGGGTSGRGVDSGIVICSAKPTTEAASPIELSRIGFIDTRDALVSAVDRHPLFHELIVAAGASTLHLTMRTHHDSVVGTPTAVSVRQTDFAADPSAVSQSVSADGLMLCSGGEDGTLRLWRYDDMKLLAIAENAAGKGQVLSGISFNRSRTLIATVDGSSECRLWDIGSISVSGTESADENVPRLRRSTTLTIPNASNVRLSAAKFSRENSEDVVTADDGDDETTEETSTIRRRRQTSAAASVSQTSDAVADEILLCGSVGARPRMRGELFLVSLSPANAAAPYVVVRRAAVSESPLVTITLSPDTHYVGTANADGAVYLLSADTFDVIHQQPRAHDLPTTAMVFSPDSQYLCSASADRTFRFLSIRHANERRANQSRTSIVTRAAIAIVMFIVVAALVIFMTTALLSSDSADDHNVGT